MIVIIGRLTQLILAYVLASACLATGHLGKYRLAQQSFIERSGTCKIIPHPIKAAQLQKPRLIQQPHAVT